METIIANGKRKKMNTYKKQGLLALLSISVALFTGNAIAMDRDDDQLNELQEFENRITILYERDYAIDEEHTDLINRYDPYDTDTEHSTISEKIADNEQASATISVSLRVLLGQYDHLREQLNNQEWLPDQLDDPEN